MKSTCKKLSGTHPARQTEGLYEEKLPLADGSGEAEERPHLEHGHQVDGGLVVHHNHGRPGIREHLATLNLELNWDLELLQ